MCGLCKLLGREAGQVFHTSLGADSDALFSAIGLSLLEEKDLLVFPDNSVAPWQLQATPGIFAGGPNSLDPTVPDPIPVDPGDDPSDPDTLDPTGPSPIPIVDPGDDPSDPDTLDPTVPGPIPIVAPGDDPPDPPDNSAGTTFPSGDAGPTNVELPEGDAILVWNGAATANGPAFVVDLDHDDVAAAALVSPSFDANMIDGLLLTIFDSPPADDWLIS